MRSLRMRLAFWFGVSFLAVTVAFLYFSHRLLEDELRHKAWQMDYPEHPDWKLHGSYSEAEVQDIMKELLEATLIGTVPLVLIVVLIGYRLARESLRPIVSVNRQLQAKTPANLGQPIELPEVDVEFRDLLRHANDLLSRLDGSFREINDYAAKVAHELRTPLTILRLKVEQAGDRIAPGLAEELEAELHRLTHVVDQSLLIARADQGRVLVQPVACNLRAVVTEVVEDFQLLAAEECRQFVLVCPADCWVRTDVRHLRQIIHNLLTNALKHGAGDFKVRVKASGTRCSLLIANRLKQASRMPEPTLGLGLRVVAALLRLEPENRYQRRCGRSNYTVRLVFPLVTPPANLPAEPSRPPRGPTPGAADHNDFLI